VVPGRFADVWSAGVELGWENGLAVFDPRATDWCARPVTEGKPPHYPGTKS
jgi:hypothetical protein